MDKDEWLRDFPKGSSLLSYLYNILISLESDLSVIDLIRKLFQKTLKPYLDFITSFIYDGEFQDPFNEFYIEKINPDAKDAKMEDDQPVHLKLSGDQKFKMRTEHTHQIPVFLSNFATQIFKSGCALSLLKEVDAQEYFKLCTFSRVKLELPSPYNMKSLNSHCIVLAKFYHWQ